MKNKKMKWKMRPIRRNGRLDWGPQLRLLSLKTKA